MKMHTRMKKSLVSVMCGIMSIFLVAAPVFAEEVLIDTDADAQQEGFQMEEDISLPEDDTCPLEIDQQQIKLEFGKKVTGSFQGGSDNATIFFTLPEDGRIYFHTTVNGAKRLWHDEFLNQDYSAGYLGGNTCMDLKAGSYHLFVSPSEPEPGAAEITFEITANFESAATSSGFEFGKTYYGQIAKNDVFQAIGFKLTKDTAVRIDLDQWEPEDNHGCVHKTGEFCYSLKSDSYSYEPLLYEFGKDLHKTLILPKGKYHFMIDATDGIDEYAVWTGNYTLKISSVDMSKPVKLKLNHTKMKYPKKDGKDSLEATLTFADGSSLTSNLAVSWSSTDPKVVTVNKFGRLEIGRYGKAVLTATAIGNKKLKARCTVQVNFYDVQDPGKYYYKPVYWAASQKIATGSGFVNYMYPETKCLREFFAIYLWRLAGKPVVNLRYAERLPGYTKSSRRAAAWLAKTGIMKGYKNNPINFNQAISRKEAMIMLWRYAGRPKVSGKLPYTDITDKKTSDSYQAILWATKKGITSGKTKTTFAPDETCTRGQVLTFLYRYAKKIGK